jgi:hypothetical protein
MNRNIKVRIIQYNSKENKHNTMYDNLHDRFCDDCFYFFGSESMKNGEVLIDQVLTKTDMDNVFCENDIVKGFDDMIGWIEWSEEDNAFVVNFTNGGSGMANIDYLDNFTVIGHRKLNPELLSSDSEKEA